MSRPRMVFSSTRSTWMIGRPSLACFFNDSSETRFINHTDASLSILRNCISRRVGLHENIGAWDSCCIASSFGNRVSRGGKNGVSSTEKIPKQPVWGSMYVD